MEMTAKAPLTTSAFLAALLANPATASIPNALQREEVRTPHKVSTTRSPLARNDTVASASIPEWWSAASDDESTVVSIDTERPTSFQEKLVGEFRRFALLSANWDGEGAALPSRASLKNASEFASLIGPNWLQPEAMLHASGRAGLFWSEDNLYGDLEFLGEGKIAYYIERGSDKHKGVVGFDSENMPPVFAVLLKG